VRVIGYVRMIHVIDNSDIPMYLVQLFMVTCFKLLCWVNVNIGPTFSTLSGVERENV
jgi:hypothetical protein